MAKLEDMLFRSTSSFGFTFTIPRPNNHRKQVPFTYEFDTNWEEPKKIAEGLHAYLPNSNSELIAKDDGLYVYKRGTREKFFRINQIRKMVVSPDEEHVALHTDHLLSIVEIINLKESTKTEVSRSVASNAFYDIKWTPNSQHLVYSSNLGVDFCPILMYSIRTEEVNELVEPKALHEHPSFERRIIGIDNEKIIYLTKHGNERDADRLFVLQSKDFKTRSENFVVPGWTVKKLGIMNPNTEFVLSPDQSKLLCYTAMMKRVINLQDKKLKNINKGYNIDRLHQLTWSPDSKLILGINKRENSFVICTEKGAKHSEYHVNYDLSKVQDIKWSYQDD